MTGLEPQNDPNFVSVQNALRRTNDTVLLKRTLDEIDNAGGLQTLLRREYPGNTTLLHLFPGMVIGDADPELLETILERFSTDEDMIEALCRRNLNGWTMLASLVNSGKPRMFEWLLENMPITIETVTAVTSGMIKNPGIDKLGYRVTPFPASYPRSSLLALAMLHHKSAFLHGTRYGEQCEYAVQIGQTIVKFLDRAETKIPDIKQKKLEYLQKNTLKGLNVIIDNIRDEAAVGLPVIGSGSYMNVGAARHAMRIITERALVDTMPSAPTIEPEAPGLF